MATSIRPTAAGRAAPTGTATRGAPVELQPVPEPMVLGVASAISARYGVSVAVVRAAFATLAAVGGFGLLAYLVLAAVWRTRPEAALAPSTSSDLAIGWITAGTVWELSHWWPGFRLALVLPVGLVSTGVALGWWRTGAERADGTGATRPTATLARIAGGLVLCIGGMAVFLGQRVDVATLRDTGLAIAVAVAGIALVLGPSAVRLVRSFSVERDERIRAQERAVVAAHLHDSVLQTLTLIQKRADDPVATASLARHQERSLRRWLYGGGFVDETGDVEPGDEGWRAAAERMVGEVEDRHLVAVELVMVGEGAVSEAQAAAVSGALAAAREALVNAAKFSGDPHLSVYCELADDRFDVFVRDRGKGFDLDTIGEDRRGIRDSIVGRMRSLGGSAEIRTAPGAGTEVHLSLPMGEHGG